MAGLLDLLGIRPADNEGFAYLDPSWWQPGAMPGPDRNADAADPFLAGLRTSRVGLLDFADAAGSAGSTLRRNGDPSPRIEDGLLQGTRTADLPTSWLGSPRQTPEAAVVNWSLPAPPRPFDWSQLPKRGDAAGAGGPDVMLRDLDSFRRTSPATTRLGLPWDEDTGRPPIRDFDEQALALPPMQRFDRQPIKPHVPPSAAFARRQDAQSLVGSTREIPDLPTNSWVDDLGRYVSGSAEALSRAPAGIADIARDFWNDPAADIRKGRTGAYRTGDGDPACRRRRRQGCRAATT